MLNYAAFQRKANMRYKWQLIALNQFVSVSLKFKFWFYLYNYKYNYVVLKNLMNPN